MREPGPRKWRCVRVTLSREPTLWGSEVEGTEGEEPIAVGRGEGSDNVKMDLCTGASETEMIWSGTWHGRNQDRESGGEVEAVPNGNCEVSGNASGIIWYPNANQGSLLGSGS